MEPEDSRVLIGVYPLKTGVTITASAGSVNTRVTGFKAGEKRVESSFQLPENGPEKTVTIMSYGKGAWLSGPGLPRRLYRGKLIFTARGGRLKIVNELELEEYLASVVSGEAGDLSQLEAYKAQAVAARTYTLKNINSHAKDGFNSCDSTHCQFYAGFGALNEKAKIAVDLTRGEVLLYKGSLASTFYHSICGGSTETSAFVWSYADMPYLVSVKDGPQGRPYCSIAPSFRWKTKIYLKALTRIARAASWIKPDEEARSMRISKRGMSGRAYELEFYTACRIVKIPATEFYHGFGRRAGWEAVRSSLFEVYCAKDYIILEGKGSGHGVGMCQWGAEGMARKGFKYREILKHYYPGTETGYD
ncbi:MAG: SpoIID/LytB domain-containing protein [Elusimicrobia bacterium]|nr:SpoIID/LytB domain-containing protein [Elusimicrobiota bacterium]